MGFSLDSLFSDVDDFCLAFEPQWQKGSDTGVVQNSHLRSSVVLVLDSKLPFVVQCQQVNPLLDCGNDLTPLPRFLYNADVLAGLEAQQFHN